MNLRNAFTYLVFLFFAYSTPLVAAGTLKKGAKPTIDADALHCMGIAYASQGKYALALAKFEAAYKIKEKS